MNILLIPNKDLINTNVYSIKSNTNSYINWKFVSEEYLKEELNHIETVFKHQNNCPSWVINKLNKQVQQVFQYQVDEGFNIIESMNKRNNKLLPNNTKTEVAFKSITLRSCFSVNDNKT